jgi:Flp pilus assembly protein TadG
VEFALVIPLLLVFFMAIIELALAVNGVMAVNRASQYGAHTASIMGDRSGADCLILTDIEAGIAAPNNRNMIFDVSIERTARLGTVDPIANSRQVYSRVAGGPSLDCTMPNGSPPPVALPYTRTVANYPESDRCSVLAGCPATATEPLRSTVDNIGVAIKYRHQWATPLSPLLQAFFNATGNPLGGGDAGWTFTQRNIFRMEPQL